MVSVFIPTKNEEKDLPGCLQSVAWSDDIHVYDSNSTDSTVKIAEAAGARVTVRPAQDPQYFGGDESVHKNWALRNIAFKYPWVLHLDADERTTPELVANVLQAVKDPGGHVAFQIQRRDFFLGTWLKHVQASPYYLRLFRPEKLHYERRINPVSVVDGSSGTLGGFLDHYPFSKGLSHWVNRHNAYSTMEAQQIIENRKANRPFSLKAAFTETNFHERRFHQKELFYRLPARPLIKFAILYFGKRGLLDGKAGFTYAVLQSFYEYMIVLKTQELETKQTS
ncbi:MAG TPA: glycosyltransferase family 2 protein [Acidisarcina sp.]|nr:glycosyltransferase family 2 protein [Acidisarcina sp.]